MPSQHLGLFTVLSGAALGVFFSSVSTYDFIQHLDREVHDVHGSFVPGLLETADASGCQATLLSPYASIFRDELWGGLPVSLLGMAAFAFLFAFAADILLRRRPLDPRATGALVLFTLAPSGASLVMAYLALVHLEVACAPCIATYVASALCTAGAVAAWRRARARWMTRDEPTSTAYLVAALGVAAMFVVAAVGAYVVAAPDHDELVASCGTLRDDVDGRDVVVPLGPSDEPAAPVLLEVLDPLCPACGALERRLGAVAVTSELQRQVVLFPLDSTCNWMVDAPIHPGACTVSEAVLCAGPRAREVLDWAFAHQEEIVARSGEGPRAVAEMVFEWFGELRGCVGGTDVRDALNRSLRWAVGQRLHVATPQLFLEGVRVCSEDLDLGLDRTLTALLERYRTGALPAASPASVRRALAIASAPGDGEWISAQDREP